jgi:hypothetical protein
MSGSTHPTVIFGIVPPAIKRDFALTLEIAGAYSVG